MIELYRELLEIAANIIEIFAVAIIVGAFFYASLGYRSTRLAEGRESAFRQYRARLGQGMLLGLEILVVADVIESITVEPSFISLGVLTFLIVIRTAISWSATLQTEGHWPWQLELPEKEESQTS